MKFFKEYMYGLGVFVLHLVFGLVTQEIFIFAASGSVLAALTIYTLCKIK